MSNKLIDNSTARVPPDRNSSTLFYGCAPPYGASALDLLDIEGSHLCPIVDLDETSLQWMEEGCQDSLKADYADTVVTYRDRGALKMLTAEDLADASLSPDGLFTLRDGQRLYFIQANQPQRWVPHVPHGRVSPQDQE